MAQSKTNPTLQNINNTSKIRYCTAPFSYLHFLSMVVKKPILFYDLICLFTEALRSFFLPQFIGGQLKMRKIINVDHPLDKKIAFNPHYIKIYLGFIKNLFITTYRLWKIYGDKVIPDVQSVFYEIKRLYRMAGSIYKHTHTTTTRPSINYNLRFAVIHALDPHLNCIPSLHVLIAIATWRMTNKIVIRNSNTCPIIQEWVETLHKQAVTIICTTMLIKQHSVNCIGATFFLLKLHYSELDKEKIDAILDCLCSIGQDVFPAANHVAKEIKSIYTKIDKDFALNPNAGWRRPLLNFILSFQKS